jgi:hypothetical protein
MKARELLNLGIPKGEPIRLAIEAIQEVGKTEMARNEPDNDQEHLHLA